MRLGKTTLVHFVSKITVSVVGFVATFAIIRLLGPAALGKYAPAVALVFWLHVPAMAVSDAVTKRLSEGGSQGHFATALVLNGAFALVVVGIVLAVDDLVAGLVGAPVTGLVALLVVGNIGFITLIGALNGRKRVASAGLLHAIERLVRTGGQIGLIFAGYGVTALFIGHVGSLAVAGAIGVVLVGAKVGRPNVSHAMSLLQYARFSWLGTLRTRAFGWMDTIVLGAFVGIGTAGPAVSRDLIGIYEVAWNLASVLALIGVSIRSTLFPELSDLATDGDYERIHHFLNEGLVFTGLFIIPGLFGAAIVGQRVLKIYDPSLQKGFVVLLVLIVARMITAFGTQLLSAINAVDRPDVTFRINAGFVATNVVLNVVLVWQFGWYGAAVATAVSAAILLVLGYRATSALIGYPDVPVSEITREVVAAAIMAGVLLFVRPYAPPNHYVTVGLVAAGSAVYMVVLLAISERIRTKISGLLPASFAVGLS